MNMRGVIRWLSPRRLEVEVDPDHQKSVRTFLMFTKVSLEERTAQTPTRIRVRGRGRDQGDFQGLT